MSQLPDPTRPASQAEKSAKRIQSGLKLEAILHSDQRRSAIINGEVKTIGSWIGSNQITDIRRDSVILSRNGKKRILRLTAAVKIKKPGTIQ